MEENPYRAPQARCNTVHAIGKYLPLLLPVLLALMGYVLFGMFGTRRRPSLAVSLKRIARFCSISGFPCSRPPMYTAPIATSANNALREPMLKTLPISGQTISEDVVASIKRMKALETLSFVDTDVTGRQIIGRPLIDAGRAECGRGRRLVLCP